MEANQGPDKVVVLGKTYPIRLWQPGMPVPVSDFLSVDSETTLINKKDPTSVPDIVIAQIFDGKTVDIVNWMNYREYFTQLFKANPKTKFIFQNAAFDLKVMTLPGFSIAMGEDRVIDVGIRYRIMKIRAEGTFEGSWSLANMCRDLLFMELDKDDAVRCAFTRTDPITDEQIVYAARDAVVTYLLNERMKPELHEYIDTRASIVLDEITRTGILVDMKAYNARKAKADKEVEERAFVMRNWGLKSSKDEVSVSTIRDYVAKEFDLIYIRDGSKAAKILFSRMLSKIGESWQDVYDEAQTVKDMIMGDPPKGKQTKQLETIFVNMVTGMGFPELADRPSEKTVYKLAEVLIKSKKAGLDGMQTLLAMRKEFDDYGGWREQGRLIGPIEFRAKLLERIQATYLTPHGIDLPKTKEAEALQFTKDERWMIKAYNITDQCLLEWADYNDVSHIRNCWFKEGMIKPDGRIHPKFSVILDTFRTSCSDPNLQQLPKKGGIREMYCAMPGHVLVAVDYSQIELCALAAHCLAMQGKSRMAELINADIDLHSWLIGRRQGIITNANDYDGTPQSVDFLKSVRKGMKKEDRDFGKSINYGLPGGMGYKRFLLDCHKNGKYTMTYEEAKDLRDFWFASFPEIKEFMAAEAVATRPGEDEWYTATNLLGRTRGRCGLCAANNYKFQSLTALATKCALWNLYTKGYKMINFVHDEVIFELPEDDKLKPTIKEIEDIMVSSVANVIKGVKIKVEATVMRHWSKEAKHTYTPDGKIIPWDVTTTKED
jgi:DNA polymerase I-like protein with 3'-5' exonuclease and polymerase domains